MTKLFRGTVAVLASLALLGCSFVNEEEYALLKDEVAAIKLEQQLIEGRFTSVQEHLNALEDIVDNVPGASGGSASVEPTGGLEDAPPADGADIVPIRPPLPAAPLYSPSLIPPYSSPLSEISSLPSSPPAYGQDSAPTPAGGAKARPLSQGGGKGQASPAAIAYNEALAEFQAGRYRQAEGLFKTFASHYPESKLLPNAGYWLGEAYYSQGQFDNAIVAFQSVAGKYPKHDKAAAALLKTGFSYEKLADTANARFYLQQLLTDYPQSEPATLARATLNRLR